MTAAPLPEKARMSAYHATIVALFVVVAVLNVISHDWMQAFLWVYVAVLFAYWDERGRRIEWRQACLRLLREEMRS